VSPWGEILAARTRAEAAALLDRACSSMSTPAEAAGLLGTVKAREISPDGWHVEVRPAHLAAWRQRVASVALARWTAAKLEILAHDAARAAEQQLVERGRRAGLEVSEGVYVRGILGRVWRSE